MSERSERIIITARERSERIIITARERSERIIITAPKAHGCTVASTSNASATDRMVHQ